MRFPPSSRNAGRFSVRRCSAPVAAEVLEDRTLLTAYIVDTLDDTVSADGKLSLREAIEAANTNAAVNEAAAGETGGAVDSITFDASLSGGTITLGGTRLNVTDSLSIAGLGASQLAISGDDLCQILLCRGLSVARH